MLLAWSSAGRKEGGDSGERRGPLTATTEWQGHSEPLWELPGCGKDTAAPVTAGGQSHVGTHLVPDTVFTGAESNQDPQEHPVSP